MVITENTHNILTNMGQRNIPCMSQLIDLEVDQQGQGFAHPEPCTLFGNITNFPQPNLHTILPALGSTHNLDVHHLPEHYDSALFCGMTPYNGLQHHHPVANLDLAVAPASNYYNLYMTPPACTRVPSVPINHGSHDQLPSSTNNGIIGASSDRHGRNNYFVDGVRGLFKRKNADGIGNFQYCNASAVLSSSVAPMNATPHESDVTLMDTASFPHPEYRGTDVSSIVDIGSYRSVRNRSGGIGLDSVMAHNSSLLIQGNYLGHPFQTAGIPWFDQQFGNGVDGGPLTWNHVPTLPYPPGSINGNCMEPGSMCMQGYQVIPSNRSSTSYLPPLPIHQGHPNPHQPPPPPLHHNIDVRSQVAASSERLSTSSTSHANMNPFWEGMEAGSRVLGSFPENGRRMYRPHQRDALLEATPRQHNLPHLRVLPEDEIAVLEIPGYHELRNPVDHHRDMRLDIDRMSYEELLALGEQIGSVGTGLSEEAIISHLKTRTFFPSRACSNLEEEVCWDQEIDFCVICLADYEQQEKIGSLDCGHEYHVDCIKKWLVVKNSCPICKSSALNTEKRDL